jgi:hypothetical protein
MQLQDSPGPSVVNAAEALLERVAAVFGGEGRLFVSFSETSETWTEVIYEADKESVKFVSDVAHAEVERLAGEAVALPSPDRWAAADLGGPRHPLLALVPAPEAPVGPFDEMDVVAVADLPWAHNPFKCAHRERFQEILGLYDKDFDGHIPAGAHFFLSLDAAGFASCRYHQHDWAAIAEASVQLLEGPRAWQFAERYVQRRRRASARGTRPAMSSAVSSSTPSPGPGRDEHHQRAAQGARAQGRGCAAMRGRPLRGALGLHRSSARCTSACAAYARRILGP